MSGTWALFMRELRGYYRARWAYGIVAASLGLNGLLFNVWALGASPRLSSQVLELFFYHLSGTILLAGVLLGMRLVVEEHQMGTWPLIATAPLSDGQVVWAKFMAGLVFVGVLNLSTLHMPWLLSLQGRLSWGHIAVGYLGEMLLGSAALAISLLCSALAPNQLVAAVSAATSVGFLITCWLLARVTAPPLSDLVAFMSLHDRHFRPFMRGVVSSADVVFYLSLTYVALTAAARAVHRRRQA